jgi:tRNA-specific 2-thiouridylase
MSKTVFVGMSGGVDSSVTALKCKQAGYDVVGVFMKNWAQDLPGFDCPWQKDYRDAKAIAVQLGIPFEMVDFQNEYRQKVVDYLIEGYRAGLTPNPDIMCNQEIKFKLFLDVAREKGADMIAMGHYARSHNGQLLTGVDESKDQTYFLYRIKESALKQTLFPVGEMHKSDVREFAAENNLITADKKDSVGICFVGKVGIRPFLKQFVDTEPGPIIDQNGEEIGQHDGAIFYTIGQRRGLGVGGGRPYYVVDKDMDSNTVYVTSKLDDEELWADQITLRSPHWINQEPEADIDYQVRVRHLGELTDASVTQINGHWQINLGSAIRALSPGQSAVVYDNDRVVGGGIIS